MTAATLDEEVVGYTDLVDYGRRLHGALGLPSDVSVEIAKEPQLDSEAEARFTVAIKRNGASRVIAKIGMRQPTTKLFRDILPTLADSCCKRLRMIALETLTDHNTTTGDQNRG